ncbi:peptidoglycan-binding domain-containing protein [Streptomyces niveus]|uniref:peptidoglycan-binding domain-containing protein n=1 Tax=Streptomyces niveus TaxID=193462 RepID=UPI0036266612
MRALTKALVGVTTAVGIAAVGPAHAASATAAPAPVQQRTASTEVAPLAVVNLGLSKAQAKDWQCQLQVLGYNTGTPDGYLGANSWKAAQRYFNNLGLKAGTPNGVVGPNTVMALQRFLNMNLKENLEVDGIPGARTKAAFAEYANLLSSVC